MFDPETLRMFFQVALAMGLGLFIGLEREYKGKAAGMRTYALVSLGAALFTILSVGAFQQFGGGVQDPARVAAQVVVGIGFLGAGLIFVQRGSVHGLTTAAGLWAVAAVGMAVGVQMYSVAVFTAVLILVILWALRKVEKRIRKHDEDQT
ncbi:MAG: MgtC/SapB family protein [bacterium]|nr:MgtC/SapB family protein [bacterium]